MLESGLSDTKRMWLVCILAIVGGNGHSMYTGYEIKNDPSARAMPFTSVEAKEMEARIIKVFHDEKTFGAVRAAIMSERIGRTEVKVDELRRSK